MSVMTEVTALSFIETKPLEHDLYWKQDSISSVMDISFHFKLDQTKVWHLQSEIRSLPFHYFAPPLYWMCVMMSGYYRNNWAKTHTPNPLFRHTNNFSQRH